MPLYVFNYPSRYLALINELCLARKVLAFIILTNNTNRYYRILEATRNYLSARGVRVKDAHSYHHSHYIECTYLPTTKYIYFQLGTNVRTVIKATSPPEPNMDAVAQFRASKAFTRLSIATAIVPSPDWFLGVSNLELCSTMTNQWADRITLNLYPLDAGTDKGANFNVSD